MLCGLMAGAALAFVAVWRHWTGWLGPLCAVLIAAALVARAWRDAPDTDAAARFLDRELRLKEQLATALELEAVGAVRSSVLAIRVREGAGLAARDALGRWSPRGVPAPREWAGAALLCALIALAAIPHYGSDPAARLAAPVPSVDAPVAAMPTIQVPQAAGTALAVQVTVIHSQATSTPTRAGALAQRLPRATPPRVLSPARAATPRPVGSSGSGRGVAGGAKGGVATATGGQRTVPLINPSESFLPTTPTTAGKGGTFTSGSQAKPGAARGGAQSGGAGAPSRGASSSAKGGTSAKGSGSGGQRVGSKGGSAAGKPGAAGGKATQCLYGCSRIAPSQLSAPGLITGKGQFTGTGIPGGKTAGHGLGAAPRNGSATTPRAPAASHQLAITSAYGPTAAGGRSARQVAGHNGAGGAQQLSATAGASGSQGIDYVAPDANVVLPGDSALVGRYFSAHRAS